jgi:hypothetical protein
MAPALRGFSFLPKDTAARELKAGRPTKPAVSEENFERGLREARQDCRMAADVVRYFGARVA